MSLPILPKWEIGTYFTVWITCALYSIYGVYRQSRRFFGNSWFDSVDDSDVEWRELSFFMVQCLFPSLLVRLLLTQIWKKFIKRGYSAFNLALSTFFWLYITEARVVALFYIVGLSFYILQWMKSSALIWMIAIAWNSGSEAVSPVANEKNTFSRYYLYNVSLSWILLRCIIVLLDRIDERVVITESSFVGGYVRMMSFVLYMPTTLGGPLSTYKNFDEAMKENYREWTFGRLKAFLISAVRYLFWWFVTEGVRRVLYFTKMTRNPRFLMNVNDWTLGGIGYCCGQFFMLKYVVFYGMVRPFAQEDGVDSPEHPKCIARIHLYSDMWRHFDRGLYLFIRDYIYRPLIPIEKRDHLGWKLLASIISFIFVYVYHGKTQTILLWSVLNFLSISVESVGKWVSKTDNYRHFEDNYLSLQNKRRLHCILIAPLTMASFMGNFYFFMGIKAGNVFVKRTLFSWPFVTPFSFFVIYCAVQGSVEIGRIEAYKLKKN